MKLYDAGELYEMIERRFRYPEWTVLPGVANATGGGIQRRCDALAMNLWPSRGLELHGFEIKVSRADFLRELKDPEKAEKIAKYCDRWWLVVASADIVQEGELPPAWGLLIARGESLRLKKEAPRLSPIEIPRYYQVLASDASNGALLEVPIPEDPAQFPRRMLYQTVHTKPVHGGYVSRGRPPFPFEGMPGFSQFTTLSNHIDDVIAYVDAELPALSVSVLMAYGTARVVVDKAAISVDDVARVRLVAQRLFGDAPPSYEDDQTLVFDVRRLPVSPSPFIWIERGWSYLERDNEPSGTTTKWRWMGRQARVGTLVPRPARARLRINARSLGQPRHLRLAIGSAQVDDIIVAADRATYETASFDLPGGVSFIDLASDVTRPGTADPRLLSVAVFQLSLLVEATSQP